MKVVFVVCLFLCMTSCSVRLQPVLPDDVMSKHSENMNVCESYFKDFFEQESSSLIELERIENLSDWQPEKSKEFDAYLKLVRKKVMTLNNTTDQKKAFQEVGLIYIEAFTDTPNFPAKACGVMPFSIFRDRAFNFVSQNKPDWVSQMVKDGRNELDQKNEILMHLSAYSLYSRP
jgi:hypothetical protein